jgi:hypothetical protein
VGSIFTNSLPSRAFVKNEWRFTSTSPYAFVLRREIIYIAVLIMFDRAYNLHQEVGKCIKIYFFISKRVGPFEK